MKKVLILVLIALLLTLSIFLMMNGVKVGGLQVLGIKEIQQESSELDSKIQQAGKLVEKDYQQAVSTVSSNAKKLAEEKKNYEDLTAINENGEMQSANQIEKYEIETLWVRLGNHATSQGAVMQMDVTKGNNSASDVYNLKFTATGSYISITDFISAIENDSTLGFKIEEFKMKPQGSELQATFVCKDIAIKDISANATQSQTDTSNSQSNTNNTSTTNTTNTSNTTNTTKTNNSTNTSNTNVAE